MALAQHEAPQIVIMDIGVAGTTGFEAVRQVRGRSAGAHIVVLTSNDAASYRTEAAAAGASAYVPKDRLHRQLLPVMQELLSGRIHADGTDADRGCG